MDAIVGLIKFVVACIFILLFVMITIVVVAINEFSGIMLFMAIVIIIITLLKDQITELFERR